MNTMFNHLVGACLAGALFPSLVPRAQSFSAADAPAAVTPRINYVTYIGGSDVDTVSGMAVDTAGSVYVAGFTGSPDFPLTSFALGVPPCPFLTKVNPSGTAIAFS